MYLHKPLLSLAIAISSFFFLLAPAQAGFMLPTPSAWTWSLTGQDISGTGTMTTLGDGTVPTDVIDFGGNVNGNAITGVVALGTDPGFIYDNVFSAMAPYFNNGGLLFALDGTGNVNLYSVTDQLYYYAYSGIPSGANSGSGIPVRFAANRVPEPTTISLLLAGLIGLALAYRKRRESREGTALSKTIA